MSWRVGQEDGYYDARDEACEWDLSVVWEARQWLASRGMDVEGALPHEVVEVMGDEYPGGFDAFWADRRAMPESLADHFARIVGGAA